MADAFSLHHGDCLSVMPTLEAGSVDAFVTDPPYGLKFMGKGWDHGVPGQAFWAEALRVAKPGAHLLAFGGTRTFHRLMCGIEDAGWDLRDTLMWVYGSGFPKSHNVSKAIDKAAGAERERIGTKRASIQRNGTAENWRKGAFGSHPEETKQIAITAPATPDAQQWDGWGTALKPAWEPIILARKPLDGTVVNNVLHHGTGAMNIDGCRIEGAWVGSPSRQAHDITGGNYAGGNGKGPANFVKHQSPLGRWPANVIHDGSEEVLEQFPTTQNHGHGPKQRGKGGIACNGHAGQADLPEVNFLDNGSAARFFYCVKASRKDRNEGLEGMPERIKAASGGAQGAEARGEEYGEGQGIGLNRVQKTRNNHPTVKPTALMRYLCRLITPPGGLIADPFMGSGSTGKAAILEGFRFLGIEQEADYIEIARARLTHAANQPRQKEIA